MPKFWIYRRPAKVSPANWKAAPDRKAEVPRKAPEADRLEKLDLPQLSPLVLQQLLRKG
jgi:hypothetical protein